MLHGRPGPHPGHLRGPTPKADPAPSTPPLTLSNHAPNPTRQSQGSGRPKMLPAGAAPRCAYFRCAGRGPEVAERGGCWAAPGGGGGGGAAGERRGGERRSGEPGARLGSPPGMPTLLRSRYQWDETPGGGAGSGRAGAGRGAPVMGRACPGSVERGWGGRFRPPLPEPRWVGAGRREGLRPICWG